jgi:hypothetical protein
MGEGSSTVNDTFELDEAWFVETCWRAFESTGDPVFVVAAESVVGVC